VWTSPDGITWSRVSDDNGVFPGLMEIKSVTAGGPGLVAVGSDNSFGERAEAAVWTSPDGITWSRVPHDEAVFGGEGNRAMNSVTVWERGLLVAVGGVVAPESVHSIVWTSPDGISWSRAPYDKAVFGGEGNRVLMNSVTTRGPGLVAVGYGWVAGAEPYPVAAAWVAASED